MADFESFEVPVEANLLVRLSAARGRSQNFESIHNHSAYALIEHDKESARLDARD